MVICISDWPTATRIGNVTASLYFSDWPTATHIRNVTGKLFTVIRLPGGWRILLVFEPCLQSVSFDQNVLVSRLPPNHN